MRTKTKAELTLGKVILTLVLLRVAFSAVVFYFLFKLTMYFLTGK